MRVELAGGDDDTVIGTSRKKGEASAYSSEHTIETRARSRAVSGHERMHSSARVGQHPSRFWYMGQGSKPTSHRLSVGF
jgi:hypothetical protein